MVSKNEKSFAEKGSEFRHRIVDAIYDKIPADVVEHLGKANKEVILAVEGILGGLTKRIDDRILKAKERSSKNGGGKNGAEQNQ